MTIEDLLELDVESLEEMSDDELRRHLEPFFPQARPINDLPRIDLDPRVAAAMKLLPKPNIVRK